MSDESMHIKQVIHTLLGNPQSASGLFNWLETLHTRELSDISKQEEFLKTIEKTRPELKVIISIARGINNTRRLNADNFRFVYAILEVLTSRGPGMKEQVTYDPTSILSQKDREALDWLSKYLEYKPGRADFDL